MSGAPDVVSTPADAGAWWDRADALRLHLEDRTRPGYTARLAALDALSDRLLRRQGVAVPGSAFLAAFLRSSNLAELVERELRHVGALERFVKVEDRKSLRILPKGVACHWIAGNVPLLGMFSWALSALAGNVNVIRLSSRQEDFITPLLESLAAASPDGARLAAETVVVRFERDDTESHRRMSALADVRIAWGGQESVEAIAALPARWECDTVVFGPRVSLGVVDPAEATDGAIGRLVTDIVYFDQLACSSPQRLFVKGHPGQGAFDQFVDRFSATFEKQSRTLPRPPLDFSETYRIQLDRTRVLLDGGLVRSDMQTQWTVAVSDAPTAAVTCMNRFVEIVPFDTLDEVAQRIPDQVQTAVTLLDSADLEVFSEAASRLGVCRFPRPGDSNGFENPWDGVPLMSRLTRWVTRTEPR